MKELRTLEGRSLVFNSVMVLLNLAGLTLLVLAYHENFQGNSTLLKLLGLMLMIGSIGGVVILRGRYLMSSVSRVLVGGFFIVSGLVKANDPVGFAYKLEEYFEDGALAYRIKEWFGVPGFSMDYLIDHALFLSVLICIIEIVLGVLTIIGGKMKLVSYMMLFMMTFFTFLTWHTANCDANSTFVDHDTYVISTPIAAKKIELAKNSNDVRIVSKTNTEITIEELRSPQCVGDCGCFGDAMKGSVGRSLTPKESLWKDIVLLYLVFWIFIAQWITKPNSRKQNIVYTLTSMGVIVFFSWVFSWYFPIFFGLLAIIGALWVVRVGGKFFGNHYGSSLFVMLLSGIFVGYVLMFLPLKDYRPFSIGSNLVDKMNDGVAEINADLLVYKNIKTGDTLQFGATSVKYNESRIWEKPDWTFESTIRKVINPAKLASIDSSEFNPFISPVDVSSFELELAAVEEQLKNASIQGLRLYDSLKGKEIKIALSDYNVTDYEVESYSIVDTIEMVNMNMKDISIRNMIVESDRFVLVFAQSLKNGNWGNIDRLKAISASCRNAGVPFAVVCGSNRKEINAFRDEHNFLVPFFVNDGTGLKAITRSNPTLIIIEKGIVKGKYPFRSTPSLKTFNTKHLN